MLHNAAEAGMAVKKILLKAQLQEILCLKASLEKKLVKTCKRLSLAAPQIIKYKDLFTKKDLW